MSRYRSHYVPLAVDKNFIVAQYLNPRNSRLTESITVKVKALMTVFESHTLLIKRTTCLCCISIYADFNTLKKLILNGEELPQDNDAMPFERMALKVPPLSH